jgi:Tfp pilus assembly protein PilF
MMRLALAGALAIAVSTAPMQCKHDPDPTLRREDSAGDALWALAQEFRAKGNPEAAKQTLRFLAERYPSNRHAPAARAELDDGTLPAPSPRAGTDAGK